MVKILIGNVFDSKAQTLVNTVDYEGDLRNGLPLAFLRRFPEMYKDYVRRCDAKEIKLGQPYLYRSSTMPWIFNIPTKGNWNLSQRLKNILQGICHLEQNYKKWGITSLAVPLLGCSNRNGRIEWHVVGKVLYRYLKQFDIPVELYAPHGVRREDLFNFLTSEKVAIDVTIS